jgi:hypothetical protein
VSPGQDFKVDIGARVSLGRTLKSTLGSREPRKDFEIPSRLANQRRRGRNSRHAGRREPWKDFEFELKNLVHEVTNQTGHMGNGVEVFPSVDSSIVLVRM